MKDLRKRHHYVPQQYLINFVDDKNKLHIYDKKEKKYYPSSPEKALVEKHFYSYVDEKGNKNCALEVFLDQKIEQGIDNIIQKMINGYKLSEKERIYFSLFMTFQFFRTPGILEKMSESYEIVEKALKIQYDSDIGIGVFLLNGLLNSGELPLLVKNLAFQNWLIIRSPQNKEFITSGEPVLLDSKYWINGDKYFPLNPNYMLLTYTSKYFIGSDIIIIEERNESNIDKINNLIYENSTKLIISKNKDTLMKYVSKR